MYKGSSRNAESGSHIWATASSHLVTWCRHSSAIIHQYVIQHVWLPGWWAVNLNSRFQIVCVFYSRKTVVPKSLTKTPLQPSSSSLFHRKRSVLKHAHVYLNVSGSVTRSCEVCNRICSPTKRILRLCIAVSIVFSHLCFLFNRHLAEGPALPVTELQTKFFYIHSDSYFCLCLHTFPAFWNCHSFFHLDPDKTVNKVISQDALITVPQQFRSIWTARYPFGKPSSHLQLCWWDYEWGHHLPSDIRGRWQQKQALMRLTQLDKLQK